MIYVHDMSKLSRSNREHWSCEYVVTYHTVNGVSDCDLIIGVIQ